MADRICDRRISETVRRFGLINKGWAAIHSLGVFPNYMVILEVVGRKSGKTVSFPLEMTIMNGERYLVSILENI